MEVQNFAKQIIDFQKSAFNNTFDSITMLQEHSEKAASTFMSSSPFMQNQNNKMIDEWFDGLKKGRDDFRKMVDDNFDKLEAFFSGK